MVSADLDSQLRSWAERRQHMPSKEWYNYLLQIYRAAGYKDREQLIELVERHLRLGDRRSG
jgi:hypothetical protein